MSSIRFESTWKKDKERDAIRGARQAVLASAEAKGLREAERRQKEDSWMLPNLDKSLDDSDEKKSRKRKKKDKKSKKHKKEKKSKKKKRKERSNSSSSSSESEEDEWVEKSSESKKKSPVRQQRESWMDFGLMAQASAMSRNTEPTKKSQKTIDRELKEEEHKKESLKRELNPNIRREHNLPVERSSTSREESKKSDQQRPPPTPVGNSWVERAYHRIKDQAEREGKSVEEVAKERWGSLDKFKSLLGKIEEDKAKVHNAKEDLRQESKSRTGWKTDSRREQDKVKSSSMMRSKTPEKEISPSSSRDTQDSKVDETDKELNKEVPENQPKVMMTEKEMNVLGAKIVKAGIYFKGSRSLSI